MLEKLTYVADLVRKAHIKTAQLASLRLLPDNVLLYEIWEINDVTTVYWCKQDHPKPSSAVYQQKSVALIADI